MQRHRCGRVRAMPPADPDLIRLHTAAVALARSMRGEPDARRFVEGLSPHLCEMIPHDRLLLIPADETPVPSPGSWLTLPLEGVDHAIGSLAIAASAPAIYTEAHVTTARRIAEMLGPLVESIVLLQKEGDRRRRMAVLPEGWRVIAGSLDVGNIFQELGAAVRTVLDFDLMLVRPIGASGTLQRSMLLVGDMPADLQPERRLEDYSFGARLAAKEIVLLGDARRELDQSFPGDRAALERGVRSVIVAPLVFGDTLGGVLAFAKHDPDWFDEGDAEVVSGIAAQVVVALQHQRLSEEQQRVAAAEQHSRWLERRVERLRGALAERYGFDSIMGRSGAIREALDQAALVAGQETTVLLTGESGTGKELVARAIHYASRRSDGPFVADEYYQLAVSGIHPPALREREGDVLVLAEYFLRTLGERTGRRQSRLSDQARQLLLAQTWPGTIRELQNAIERALIADDGRVISPVHLGIAEHGPLATGLSARAPIVAGSVPTDQPLVEVEKQAVAEALRHAKGNKTRAAAALGLSRGAFYRRLERFGFVA